MSTAVLIVAAGRGARAAAQTGGAPKQYARLGGVPVLARTIAAFAGRTDVAHITVVIHADDRELYDAAIAGLAPGKLTPPALGGATRQQSVRLGLEALAASGPEWVLIHDAARPFVSPAILDRIRAALTTTSGAIAALPLSDTLKMASAQGTIARTVPRENLWRAQTPQAFRFNSILEAHRRAHRQGLDNMTDDAAIAEWDGLAVALVEGGADNIKLTTPEDMAMAERMLAAATLGGLEPRIGQGFDVHKFAPGDHVWLGGVKIPHTHRLEGHSDADVVLHALTDALLGTIGDGDIGQHFPPSDPQWKGAASRLFLEHAAQRVRARGGRIVNADVTVLAEAPRIGPHRTAMQQLIGEVLGLSADRIGIKATTTEGLGFTGRREGIAAMATATVLLSSSYPAAS